MFFFIISRFSLVSELFKEERNLGLHYDCHCVYSCEWDAIDCCCFFFFKQCVFEAGIDDRATMVFHRSSRTIRTSEYFNESSTSRIGGRARSFLEKRNLRDRKLA